MFLNKSEKNVRDIAITGAAGILIMSSAQLPQLGFNSEPVYDVTYIENDGMNFDPSQYDEEYVYLSEVIENCKNWGCRAILWTGTFKEGEVLPTGDYQLY